MYLEVVQILILGIELFKWLNKVTKVTTLLNKIFLLVINYNLKVNLFDLKINVSSLHEFTSHLLC